LGLDDRRGNSAEIPVQEGRLIFFANLFDRGRTENLSRFGFHDGPDPPAALEALRLQRPLVDNALIVVARGEKQDP
jgi:hypothetical protein